MAKEPINVIKIIRERFEEEGNPAIIPMQNGGHFIATLNDNGIKVSNLGNQPFLPWSVFDNTLILLTANRGRALRGDAMNFKLGEEGLPLDSVEGHVAHYVYGKQLEDSVFRRITPIAGILIWAGICKARPGELILR